jgi:uncharacterized damage-inducible protein DinB
MRKYKLSILIVLLTAVTVVAQTDKKPKTSFTEMYLPVWETAAEHCLEVARAMPENKYDYKPTTVSKTFGEQIVHIAHTVELLTKRYVQGMEVKPNTPDASTMSKAEIISLLEDGLNYVTEVVYSIEQAQLDENCVMYHSGNTVSRAFALFYVQDHMNNHRAKANLYIRMNDINPPEYTW